MSTIILVFSHGKRILKKWHLIFYIKQITVFRERGRENDKIRKIDILDFLYEIICSKCLQNSTLQEKQRNYLRKFFCINILFASKDH